MSSDRMKRYVPLVQRFAARVVLLHEAAASLLGLHATDVKVIGLLGDRTMTAGELVEHTGLTGASVTALVDRLEAAGYVTRFRDTQDRRKVGIRAIPAQKKKVDRMYDKLNSAMTDVISSYTEQEFTTVIDYLTRTSAIVANETKDLHSVAKKRPKRVAAEA
jgi:DNA-binding MarR family transcriptional regulator